MDIDAALKLRKNIRMAISKEILKLIGHYGRYYPGTIIRGSEHEAFNSAINAAASVALDDSDLYLFGSVVRVPDIEKSNRTVDDDDDDHTSTWGGAGPDCIPMPE